MTAVWLFKLFDQVWAKENYGDIIDGHHPFRHCQQICPKLSNLLSRSDLSFYIVSGIWSNEGSFWRHQYNNIIFRSFSMCVHVPSVWDRHVCLDDGALRWWAFPLNFTISFLECFSPSGQIKTVLGACPHYNFGFWGLMTALIAYLVPDWRDMQVAAKLIPQIKQLLVCSTSSASMFSTLELFLSWYFPCPLCCCTAPTGSSPSHHVGSLQMAASRKLRILSERLQGETNLNEDLMNVSEGQMVEFYQLSGDSSHLLRAAAVKVSTLKIIKSNQIWWSFELWLILKNVNSDQIWRFELWLILKKKTRAKKLNIKSNQICRRRQRYQLLPFVHNAEHEEENVHLLLPLVQVMQPSKPHPIQQKPKVQHFLHKFKTNPRALIPDLICLNLLHEGTVINNQIIFKVNQFKQFQHSSHLLRTHPQLEHSQHRPLHHLHHRY